MTLSLGTVVCFLLCLEFVRGAASPKHTTHGWIRGMTRELFPGARTDVYLGIPYAQPPIGDLRFEDPLPPRPWQHVMDTTKLPPMCEQYRSSGDKCLQYVQDHRVGFDRVSEDCLYLNVYVPLKASRTEPLSVLLFVHGGSNVFGMGAMFDGDILACHGSVIVVTFNYRLGALGFLGTGNEPFRGNYGAMDQLMVFKWVQKNIAIFGGNPDEVTLVGHSAGSWDVATHLVSPLSKGLFRSVFCESGPPLSHITYRIPGDDPEGMVRRLAARLGCSRAKLLDVKRCLKTLPTNLTVAYYEEVYDPYPFSVIVDGYFLPSTPKKLISAGAINTRSVMLGVVRNEGALTGYDAWKTWEPMLKLMQSYRILPSHKNLRDVLQFEYKDFTRWNGTENVGKSLVISLGESLMDVPAVISARCLYEANATVYLYRFTHQSTLSTEPPYLGVPHGVDLFYFFGVPISGHPLHNYTEVDKAVSRMLMTSWTNFVKNGVPSVPNGPTKAAAYQYTPTSGQYIEYHTANGTAIVSRRNHLKARRVYFWTEYVPKIAAKLQDARSLTSYGHVGESHSIHWIIIQSLSIIPVMRLLA